MGSMPEGLRPSGGAGSAPGGAPGIQISPDGGYATLSTPGGTLGKAAALREGYEMPGAAARSAYITEFDRWLDKSPALNMPDQRIYHARDKYGELFEVRGKDIKNPELIDANSIKVGGVIFDREQYRALDKQFKASQRGFEREIENHQLIGKMKGFIR